MAARKPAKIPAGMSVMLGREAEHPTVKVGKRMEKKKKEIMGYYLQPCGIFVGQKVVDEFQRGGQNTNDMRWI